MDIRKALLLAARSQHPDAQWLVSVTAGQNVANYSDLKVAFLKDEHDARASCFLWLLSPNRYSNQGNVVSLLERSAKLGYPFAMAYLAKRTQNWQLFATAASLGERNAYHAIGIRLTCPQSAMQNLRRAAQLGKVGMQKNKFIYSSTDQLDDHVWDTSSSL